MDPASEAHRRDPYPAYAQLRAHAPVHHLPAQGLWLLTRHDDVRRALSDHEAFSSEVGPLRGARLEWLLFTDPPRHTALRAIVQKAFTPRSIAALEPRVRALSASLLDPVMARGSIDLVADYATPLPLLVIAEMLGVPASDWPRLARWSEAIIGLGGTIAGEDPARASAAFVAADAEMAAYFGAHVAARRARSAPADDLLGRLVDAGLDDVALLRFCELLLAAGTETTTNLIDNAMISFAEHPGELARVRVDPSLLPSAIEEVLRYRAPLQAMFRATRRAIDLDGASVPAGAFVVCSIGAANRDPARFAEPDRFDAARDPNPHVAFGHGIHFCLGAPLSRLEARVALGDLLARFASFEVARDWRPRAAFHVLGPASLPVRFTRA